MLIFCHSCGAKSQQIKEQIQTDGEIFKLAMGGFTIDFAWYYKGRDTKFDFNTPITKDIEIETKTFDGIIDNDFFEDIYDIFYQ